MPMDAYMAVLSVIVWITSLLGANRCFESNQLNKEMIYNCRMHQYQVCLRMPLLAQCVIVYLKEFDMMRSELVPFEFSRKKVSPVGIELGTLCLGPLCHTFMPS